MKIIKWIKSPEGALILYRAVVIIAAVLFMTSLKLPIWGLIGGCIFVGYLMATLEIIEEGVNDLSLENHLVRFVREKTKEKEAMNENKEPNSESRKAH